MTKELEEIKSIVFVNFGALGFYNPTMNEEILKDRDKVLNYLTKFDAIDNANPSKALKELEEIENYINNIIFAKDLRNQKQQLLTNITIIKQALLNAQENERILDHERELNNQLILEAQEKEKVLNVIFKKPLQSATTINYLKINQVFHDMLDYERYCLTVKEKIRNTEEEFDLLKKVVKSVS